MNDTQPRRPLAALDPADPADALELLDRLVGQMTGSRADHRRIDKAVETLAQTIGYSGHRYDPNPQE